MLIIIPLAFLIGFACVAAFALQVTCKPMSKNDVYVFGAQSEIY